MKQRGKKFAQLVNKKVAEPGLLACQPALVPLPCLLITRVIFRFLGKEKGPKRQTLMKKENQRLGPAGSRGRELI